MNNKRIALFVLLVIGSIIFFFSLSTSMSAKGSGDPVLLNIWAVLRCLQITGLYLIFVSIVFGVNCLLLKDKEEQSGV